MCASGSIARVGDHVALSIMLSLGLVLVGSRVSASVRALRARRRMRRASEGETYARDLLERRGYAIVGEQVRGRLVLIVDGVRCEHALRADYLVARGGRRYVAEVKTGALAPSLDHAPTRRQIVEYCAAFEVDRALLVEPEADRVREIGLPARRRSDTTRVLVLGIALGAALVWLAR